MIKIISMLTALAHFLIFSACGAFIAGHSFPTWGQLTVFIVFVLIGAASSANLLRLVWQK